MAVSLEHNKERRVRRRTDRERPEPTATLLRQLLLEHIEDDSARQERRQGSQECFRDFTDQSDEPPNHDGCRQDPSPKVLIRTSVPLAEAIIVHDEMQD